MEWTLSNLIAEVGPVGAYIVQYGILVTYIFFGIALFLAVLFPAIQMVRNIKTALKTLVSVAILVVVFFVCYSMAAAESFTTTSGEEVITIAAGTMKVVEGCIYMTYVLFFAAILFVIIAPLYQYIKR